MTTKPDISSYDPFPTLLTKDDCLEYMADRIDNLASYITLVGLTLKIADEAEIKLPEKLQKEDVAELRRIYAGVVDEEIQTKVMREAAAEMRAMARENKLARARAEAHGINTPTPTKGI